jgi:hypothetical protein
VNTNDKFDTGNRFDKIQEFIAQVTGTVLHNKAKLTFFIKRKLVNIQ